MEGGVLGGIYFEGRLGDVVGVVCVQVVAAADVVAEGGCPVGRVVGEGHEWNNFIIGNLLVFDISLW